MRWDMDPLLSADDPCMDEGPELRRQRLEWLEKNTCWGGVVERRSEVTGEEWEEHPLLPLEGGEA